MTTGRSDVRGGKGTSGSLQRPDDRMQLAPELPEPPIDLGDKGTVGAGAVTGNGTLPPAVELFRKKTVWKGIGTTTTVTDDTEHQGAAPIAVRAVMQTD